MTIVIPVRTWSESNERVYWRKRANRVKKQRMGAMIMVRTSIPWRDLLDEFKILRVTLIRVGPQILDDDNVRGALKAVRDGVADAFELDDRDPRFVWKYGQERGEYSVRVEIQGRMS